MRRSEFRAKNKKSKGKRTSAWNMENNGDKKNKSITVGE
jgi:hypothetical protein